MNAIDFFSQYTFGQWIVITIVGMVILSGVFVIGIWRDGFDEVWIGIIVGPLLYLFGFLILTVLLWIVSFLQWLWVL